MWWLKYDCQCLWRAPHQECYFHCVKSYFKGLYHHWIIWALYRPCHFKNLTQVRSSFTLSSHRKNCKPIQGSQVPRDRIHQFLKSFSPPPEGICLINFIRSSDNVSNQKQGSISFSTEVFANLRINGSRPHLSESLH